MNPKGIYAGLVVIIATIILGGFQNCAEPLPDLTPEQKSTGTNTGRFAAGDPFSANKLPYAPQGSLISDLDSYLATSGFKAVAIAANGMGVARGHAGLASQAEANRFILEACQIVARNQPCGLFAEGNVIKYNEEDFQANQRSVLEFGARTFNANKVPALTNANRATLDTAYDAMTNPAKAVAIGNFGLVARGWGATQAEANRSALQMCEAVRQEPCTLYASGNTVVFNVTQYNWNYTTSHIVYGPRTYAANQVPFVSDAVRQNTELTTVASLTTNGRNPVLAISRVGHFGFAATAGATLAANRTAALAECNAKRSASATIQCVVYSERDQVVMTKASLAAGNSP